MNWLINNSIRLTIALNSVVQVPQEWTNQRNTSEIDNNRHQIEWQLLKKVKNETLIQIKLSLKIENIRRKKTPATWKSYPKIQHNGAWFQLISPKNSHELETKERKM